MNCMFTRRRASINRSAIWDTSKVTDMESCSRGAAFNQPIGDWDTSKVTDMKYMFYEASSFNRPIGDWDTSKVTSMSAMFDGATAYNAAKAAAEAKAKAEAEAAAKAAAEAAKPEPFADSAALKTAVDNCLRAVPSGLDCCKPKSEGGGGADCGAGKHAAIGDWDTSKVTSMEWLFSDCTRGDAWCGGVKIHRASFNQPIGKWDTSQVTSMKAMFHGGMEMQLSRSTSRSENGTPPRSPTWLLCLQEQMRSINRSETGIPPRW